MTDVPKYEGPRLVPLLDGTLAFDDSEEYRLLCEARWVASLPYREREDWLAGLVPVRGAEAVEYLRKTVNEVIAVAAAGFR